MKRFLTFLTCSLIIVSCSINRKDYYVIEVLDQFETQNENEQLGKDLLNYSYADFLPLEFPDFTTEVFSNITWQYFIQDNNKQVSFRLILSNDALQHKDRIVQYYERTVNRQIQRQIEDKDLFESAIKLSLEHLNQLDENNYDEFWENTSWILRKTTSKSAFIDLMEYRKDLSEIGGKRELLYKLYYERLPGSHETGFYVVGITFERNNTRKEQLTYHLEDGELKISGYHFI